MQWRAIECVLVYVCYQSFLLTTTIFLRLLPILLQNDIDIKLSWVCGCLMFDVGWSINRGSTRGFSKYVNYEHFSLFRQFCNNSRI